MGMNVTERIQLLREETAKTAADWLWHSNTSELEVHDDAHMRRWSPQAAARALDLLTLLFDKHTAVQLRVAKKDICHACPIGYWPCVYYTAALALLDTLDPGKPREGR